jgi:hypothetical protein
MGKGSSYDVVRHENHEAIFLNCLWNGLGWPYDWNDNVEMTYKTFCKAYKPVFTSMEL